MLSPWTFDLNQNVLYSAENFAFGEKENIKITKTHNNLAEDSIYKKLITNFICFQIFKKIK